MLANLISIPLSLDRDPAYGSRVEFVDVSYAGMNCTVTGHEPDWLSLLDGLELTHGEPRPVPPADNDWEALGERFGMTFPVDYKQYCICLGPGDWSGAFHIAVPKLGKKGGQYDLDQHNEWMHPNDPDIDMIGKENLPLFQRAVHFASDVVGNSYYWDPNSYPGNRQLRCICVEILNGIRNCCKFLLGVRYRGLPGR